MPRKISDEITDFERKLGLPKGFYKKLLEDDDWSFIIKLNALFEAACTHVLAERLNAPTLTVALSHLDFANAKYGKIVLLRSLEAINSEQATFLRKLAELRNNVVHNILNVGFSFPEYISNMNSDKVKSFVKAFGHGIKDEVEIAGKKIPKAEFVRENPKLSIWTTAAEILACLYLEFGVAELRLMSLGLSKFERLIESVSKKRFPVLEK